MVVKNQQTWYRENASELTRLFDMAWKASNWTYNMVIN
jgi:hypothetical protein